MVCTDSIWRDRYENWEHEKINGMDGCRGIMDNIRGYKYDYMDG